METNCLKSNLFLFEKYPQISEHFKTQPADYSELCQKIEKIQKMIN